MTDIGKHILIVDDEPQVRGLLAQALKNDGFEIFEAANRDEAMRCIAENTIDLITLDLRLDCANGLDVAVEIRSQRNIPIIIITACNKALDRIKGLEHGADDYITKPFHIREVTLRLRNVLKRYSNPIDDQIDSRAMAQRFTFEDCILDAPARELRSRDGERIDLTDLEFRLLLLLVRNCTRVLSRDEISRALNGHDWSPPDRTIDGHVARLRRKLEPAAAEPRLIKSVRGVGYVFAGEVLRI